MTVLNPQPIIEKLERDGLAVVKKKLADRQYRPDKVDFVLEWVRQQEAAEAKKAAAAQAKKEAAAKKKAEAKTPPPEQKKTEKAPPKTTAKKPVKKAPATKAKTSKPKGKAGSK